MIYLPYIYKFITYNTIILYIDMYVKFFDQNYYALAN